MFIGEGNPKTESVGEVSTAAVARLIVSTAPCVAATLSFLTHELQRGSGASSNRQKSESGLCLTSTSTQSYNTIDESSQVLQLSPSLTPCGAHPEQTLQLGVNTKLFNMPACLR